MGYNRRRINLKLSLRTIYELFTIRKYNVIFVLFFIAITALYFILLPMLPFGTFFLSAVRFITPIQVIFSIVMGFLFSILILLSMRSHALGVRINKGAGAASVLTSIVNVFCCTPIIPLFIGIAGASSPFIFRYSPRVQYFFAVDYPIFYLVSVLLLTYSVLTVASNIGCCKLDPITGKNVPSLNQEA